MNMLVAKIVLNNKGLLEENFIPIKPKHISVFDKETFIRVKFDIPIRVSRAGEIALATTELYLKDICIYKEPVFIIPAQLVNVGDIVDISWDFKLKGGEF